MPTSAPSALSVGDVNDFLDALVRASPRDDGKRKCFQARVKDALSPLEHKWLARIVLRDLKAGLRHESVLAFLGEGVDRVHGS